MQVKDSLIWQGTLNELFSVCSAYHMEKELQSSNVVEALDKAKGILFGRLSEILRSVTQVKYLCEEHVIIFFPPNQIYYGCVWDCDFVNNKCHFKPNCQT
jgi:hypothetical protein